MLNSYLFVKYAGIIIPTISVLIAQLIKYILAVLKKEAKGYKLLASTGRMPSGHATLTTSILVYTLYKVVVKDSDPAILGVALVLWYVVLRDAIGVRKEVEKQSRILNRFVLNEENKETLKEEKLLERNKNKKVKDIAKEKNKNKEKITDEKILSENQGHTVVEVLAGIILGIVVPLIYFDIFF